MATEVIIKKWGNSMGVVLPRELIEEKGLREHERIFVEVVKEGDIRDLFGVLPRKLSGQKFKDLVREGWGS